MSPAASPQPASPPEGYHRLPLALGAVLAVIWLLTMGGIGIAAGGGAVGLGLLLIPICMLLGMLVELATIASKR